MRPSSGWRIRTSTPGFGCQASRFPKGSRSPRLKGTRSPAAPGRITWQEFLRREAQSPTKHHFIDGRMVEREALVMAGGSPNHVRITPVLSRMLGNALRGRMCQSFDRDTLVHIDEIDWDDYPDAGIACPSHFVSETVGVIDNPRVIFEVLSPVRKRTTEATSSAAIAS